MRNNEESISEKEIEQYLSGVQEQLDEQYQDYIDGVVKDRVELLLRHTDKTREKTLERKKKEIYEAFEIVTKSLYLTEIHGRECRNMALAMTALENTDSIESSAFLAMHGKYKSAMMLLRNWLEVTFKAMYYDLEVKKSEKREVTMDKRRRQTDEFQVACRYGY